MREIELTQGKTAIVDDADFEKVAKHKWYARRKRKTWEAATSMQWYGMTMGRYLMGCEPGDGKRVKHRNGNRLDCRRGNLAFVEKNKPTVGDGGTVWFDVGHGRQAVVDKEDWERVRGLTWHGAKGGNTWYASANVVDGDGVNKPVSLHRFVLGLTRGDGKVVDHRNRNGLDNRRENLRVCDTGRNIANSRKHRDGKHSRFKGVTKFNRENCTKPWIARIVVDYKARWLGTYETEIEAARAYDREARAVWGRFARCNFTVE